MSELPKGWASARLNDVCELINGRAYKQSELLAGGRYPVLRVGNFFSNRSWYYSNLELEPNKYCDRGDLLYAWSASFGPRIWEGEKSIFHYHIWKISLNDLAVEKRFLYHWFEWDKENIKAEHGTGSTMIHVTKGDMEARALELPSLPEQRRIVAKIDNLADKSRRTRDHLDRVPRLVEKFKQAVFAAAFRGELSANDRFLKGWENWTFERANDVCAKVQSGGTPKSGFVADGVPFLKVYNIVKQAVSFDYRPQFVDAPVHLGELRKSVTFPGDVLMNIVGPPLGKVAIVPENQDQWNINQALALFRPSDRISTKWIYYYLCSGIPVSEIMNETKGSAGQVNISLSQCRDLIFPVPSREEQAEVVRRIEATLTWIDRLATEAASARTLTSQLDQAVLAKAFRGELVLKDPADEPASVLLERIVTERGAAPTARRGRKAKAI